MPTRSVGKRALVLAGVCCLAVAAMGFRGSGASAVEPHPNAGAPVSATASGYRFVASDGGIFSFGNAAFHGSMGGRPLNAPIVGMAATPDGKGYWLVASDGGIFSFGNAAFHGSMGGRPLNAPIVGMAADPATGGYWFVASDGGIFSFDAPFYGSMGAKHLNAPIVGMAATPDGKGYWFVASDGGIFSFGNAAFHGSMGGRPLNAPIVGMAADPATGGYWFVASDGGIFSFDAPFYGSMGAKHLNAPIVGMAATPDGAGYWFVASDGGIFSFGDAKFYGSMGGRHLNAGIVGMAATPPGSASTAGSKQIVITSDQSVILPGAGAQYQLTAALKTASGIVEGINPKNATWQSSDPAAVSVSDAGLLTAGQSVVGSAEITVSMSGVAPAIANAIVAIPATGTILVPSRDVIAVSVDPATGIGRATLTRTPATETIQVGNIVVSNSRGGLLATVAGVSIGSGSVTLSTTPASLAEAFDNLAINVRSAPAAMKLTISDGHGEIIGAAGQVLSSFHQGSISCVNNSGKDVTITVTGPSVSANVTVQLIGILNTSWFKVTDFELAAQVTIPVTINTGSVNVQASGTLGATCTLNVPSISLPTPIWVGPVDIAGTISPSAGIAVTGQAQANLNLSGPSISDTFTATDGIEYTNSGGWQYVEQNTSTGAQVAPPSWSFSASISATLSPFLEVAAGFQATLGICPVCTNLAGANLAFAKAAADFHVGINSPFQYFQSGYTGPTWNADISLSAGPEFQLTGDVATFLKWIGVNPPDVQWPVFTDTIPLGNSPTVDLGVSPSSLTAAGSITLTAAVPSGFDGDTVKFVGYRSTSPSGTVLGTTSVSGSSASTTWTPTAADDGSYDVVALLFDKFFGRYGFPYASSTSALSVALASATSTSTTVVSSSASSTPDQQVTFTATVSPTPDGGTVDVTATTGGATTTLCQAAPLSSGTAKCPYTFSAAGTYVIQATYSGDANFQGSTSNTITQTVAEPSARATSTTVVSSSASSTPDQQVTFTAMVSPTPDGGTVDVTATTGGATTTLCQAAPLSSGTAKCPYTFSAAGTYVIQATYSGDANFQGSTSNTITQTVGTSIPSFTETPLDGANSDQAPGSLACAGGYCYVSTDNNDTSGGNGNGHLAIWSSADNGASWSQYEIQTFGSGAGGVCPLAYGGSAETCIAAFGSTAVVLAASAVSPGGSALFSTTDGGMTWTENPLPQNEYGFSLSCVTPSWCAVLTELSSSAVALLTTSDFGGSWTSASFDAGYVQNANELICPIVGVCIANLQDPGLMITTNSGSSWQPFGPSGSTEPVACLPASSLSSTDCWVTHGSQVEATTDGGSSWSAFGAPLSNVVYAISCISPATCGILLGGGTNDGSSIVESTTTGWDTLETFPYIDQVGNLVFDSPSDTLVAVGVDLTNTSLSGDQVVWSQAPGAAPARALARSGGNRPRSVLGGNATSRGSVSYGPRAGTEHVWLSEATRPRDQGSIPARPSIDSRHPARSSGLAVRSASSST